MKILNLDRVLKSLYAPKYFNDSDIKTLMINKDNYLATVLLSRGSEKNKKIYETFDHDFSLYLNKIPQSLMKKNVGFIFNKKLIFIGAAKNSELVDVSRCFVSKDLKFAGTLLNSYALDIEIGTGNTPQIDECILASYMATLRAATIINKQTILKDTEFHKLVTSFLLLLFMKIFKKQINITSSVQRSLIHFIVIYLYMKQFLEMKHLKILHMIEKEFVDDLISKDDYEKIKDYGERLQPFTSFKDIFKIFNEFSIISDSSQKLMFQFIKIVDKNAFYAVIGSLDALVAALICSKYPTDLISKNFSVGLEFQNKLEEKMSKYIEKMQFDTSLVNNSEEK